MRSWRWRHSASAAWKAVRRRAELVCLYARSELLESAACPLERAFRCIRPRVSALLRLHAARERCKSFRSIAAFAPPGSISAPRSPASSSFLHICDARRIPCDGPRGALALLTAEASLGRPLARSRPRAAEPALGPRSRRRRAQAPATATDRIAQVTIGAYVAQVARPSLAALGARSTRLILRAGQWWRLATPMLLHGSPAHLMVNMLALRNVGGCVEIKQ